MGTEYGNRATPTSTGRVGAYRDASASRQIRGLSWAAVGLSLFLLYAALWLDSPPQEFRAPDPVLGELGNPPWPGNLPGGVRSR